MAKQTTSKSRRGQQKRSKAASKAVRASGAQLGRQPRSRRPSRLTLSGRANPDPLGISLADRRLHADASAPLFTLEDAIALALANNPQRAQAQAAVDAATANIGVVGSTGKLQVQANGETQYGRNTQTSNALATSAASGSSGTGSTTGGSGTGGSTGTTSGPSRSFLRFDQLEVDATQPITNGGRVRASTRQARFQALAQIYGLAQVEQTLVLNTTLGYLDVLRADQLLRVTNANLAVSQERLRVARLRYGVGASARLDVLQAQADLANARTLRINAANALGINDAALNVLLGRSPELAIRIAPISRLTLPSIAYGVAPGSVLTPAQRSNSTNGTRAGTTATGGATGLSSSSGTPLGNTQTITPGATSGGATSNGTTSGGTTSLGGISSGSSPAVPNTNAGTGAIIGSTGTSVGTAGTTSPTLGSTGTGTTATPGTTGTTGTLGSSGTSPSTTGTTTTTSTGTTTTSAVGSPGSLGTLGTGAVSSGASAGIQALAGGTQSSLAVTQAQIGAAQEAIRVAQSNRRPQLGLTLSGLLRNPATFLGNFGTSIGLGLAQDLFDSGRTRDQVRVARAALVQLQDQLAGQRLQVAQAIETSLLSLDSSQRRQANAEAGVVSAREALRVAQIGFRSGVRTTLDLATAQSSLLSAQTDAVNARFDVADAQATLAAAIGIYTTQAQAARERAIRAQQDAAAQAQRQIQILQPKKKRKRFLGIF